MNNEIKEILDNLDFNINHTSNWIVPLALNQESWKTLLDYITNLQQENERLKSDKRKLIEYIYKHPVNSCHELFNILQ